MKSQIGKIINSAGYVVLNVKVRPFIKYLPDIPLIGVEIGTFKGINALEIVKNKNIKKLFCIDPYEDYTDAKGTGLPIYSKSIISNAKLEAHQRLDKFSCVDFIKSKSEDVITQFDDESLDFVYIDGNHNYESVKLDLQWHYKVKKNGIIAGHDIHIPDVFKAVAEFSTKNNLKVQVDYPDWIIMKGKET